MREQLRRKDYVHSEVKRTVFARQDWASGLFFPKNRLSKNTEQVHINWFPPVGLPTASPHETSLPASCFCDWQKQRVGTPPATHSPPLPNNCTSWPFLSAAPIPPVPRHQILWIWGQGFLASVPFLSSPVATSLI